ncbi:hypothetical protein [Clostridium tertium]|uniref:hypothetical protein n=1 Tax=Clostridium tertium TaxID=1559 RepID=UPI003564D103
MKRLMMRTSTFIKNKLGLCNTKDCYRKAAEEIEIECISIKRCLCKKHLKQYKELTKKYSTGIGATKEEDKIALREVVISINNKFKQEKSKQERQLDKLYKLLKGARKNRVKKKINKRIYKLKGDEKCGKHRRVN